jgi:hypothetical protein
MSAFRSQRRLRVEALEPRTVFSTMGVLPHNFVFPEDCDNSGDVTPLDALALINAINRNGTSSGEGGAELPLDVNADGQLTPLDPLVVINHLNRSEPSGVSSVPVETRIARLQSDIAAMSLPSAWNLDQAREILATLNSGGLPERGERFIDGRLRSALEVQRIQNEQSAANLALPIPDADPTQRIQNLVEHFAARLTSAGVDAQVISTIATEIKQNMDAGTPLTVVQIKDRLTELGVDVAELFPSLPDRPNPNANPELGNRINEWTERLRSAGVRVEIVTTLIGEIRASIDAGTPMTVEQIRTRLTDLGVDVSQLFPPRSGQPTGPRVPTPRIELVTSILRRAEVAPSTIEVVRTAMSRASSAGQPLTGTQILSLLRERGVQLPSALARLLGLAA